MIPLHAKHIYIEYDEAWGKPFTRVNIDGTDYALSEKDSIEAYLRIAIDQGFAVDDINQHDSPYNPDYKPSTVTTYCLTRQ